MSAELNVAIVGSGPAGLYAADELLKMLPDASVDMYDKLPTPGGLVRSGVSPDHAQRRLMAEVYENQIFASGRYRFHGNVEIGKDLSQQELLQHHHAVIYASGAASDRQLNIPGEHLPGSHAATDFVAWYNGHPDHAQDRYDLSTQRAVVIGNGNVALDVARMLLLSGDNLSKTDISATALAALAKSSIKEVVLLGRRGPSQAAFTLPELLELERMADVDIVIESAAAIAAGENAGQAMRLDVLRKYAAAAPQGREKRLVFRFLQTPLEVMGDQAVAAVKVAKNKLISDDLGVVRAVASDEIDEISTGLVIRAVGYKGQAVPGLPFDEAAGVIANTAGRVHDCPRVYVAGWLKRGPRGVIGTNKQCSKETVSNLVRDWRQGKINSAQSTAMQVDSLLKTRGVEQIDVYAWRKIDGCERNSGTAQGRPRVKFLTHANLMKAASGASGQKEGLM